MGETGSRPGCRVSSSWWRGGVGPTDTPGGYGWCRRSLSVLNILTIVSKACQCRHRFLLSPRGWKRSISPPCTPNWPGCRQHRCPSWTGRTAKATAGARPPPFDETPHRPAPTPPRRQWPPDGHPAQHRHRPDPQPPRRPKHRRVDPLPGLTGGTCAQSARSQSSHSNINVELTPGRWGTGG